MSDATTDIEAIKQLKARYFRLMDTKDWEAMSKLFTDDVRIDVSSDGAGVYEGRQAFMDMLINALSRVESVHHGHMPEIELTSATTASGIWAMEDNLRFPEGAPLARMHGFGHYHDTYAKGDDGQWRISASRLTRLRIEIS